MLEQQQFEISTRGRGTYEISREIQQMVQQSSVQTGLCHVFIHHTSASLVLCENADPSVRSDLDDFFTRLVPDGDSHYSHTMEGPDDMPAHIRSILTNMDLTLPVTDGRCALGTWQGIYLFEHRTASHRRRITVTIRD